jgi:hypothetical protein
MLRVDERRRHQRDLLTCPVTLRDKAGRVLFRGRSADIAPGGIRIMGQGGRPLEEGQPVWVELSLRRCRSTGQRTRIIKVSGEVRRVEIMGEWRSVIVIIFDTEFKRMFLDPTL